MNLICLKTFGVSAEFKYVPTEIWVVIFCTWTVCKSPITQWKKNKKIQKWKKKREYVRESERETEKSVYTREIKIVNNIKCINVHTNIIITRFFLHIITGGIF